MTTLPRLAPPEFRARMDDLGLQTRTGSPAEFDACLKSETGKWARVVKAADVPQE